MLRFSVLIAALAAVLLATPAAAATTVYGAGILSQSGPIIGASQALGPADGLSAIMPRNTNILMALDGPTTGQGVTVAGTRGPATTVQVSVGAIVGGVAVFTPVQNFTLSGATVFDFSADCALISVTGCSLIQFNVLGGPSALFTFDGVSGVAHNPEPGTWALLILGFAGVSMRMKQLRGRGALRALPAAAAA